MARLPMLDSGVRGAVRHIVVGLAALAVAGGAALAQPGRGGWRELTRPGVTSEEIERIGEMLSLGEDQEMVAQELHAGYLSQVDAMGEEVREVMEAARDEFRETRDFTIWRDLGEVMAAFEDRKDGLTESFMSDLRLVLTPDQDARWAEVERFHRRYTTLDDRGLISGEAVDLIALVDSLELDPETASALAPTMEQYELELDRVLIERNRAYEEGLDRGRAMFFDGETEELEKLYEEAKDAAVRLRDLHRRYARQIMTSLDDAAAAEMQREFDRRSFPRIYREGLAEQAFATVSEMSDLDEQQRERVAQLESAFRRELGAANQRLVEATEQLELERGVESLMPRRGRPGGEESEALRDARQAKRALTERYVERLRDVLTEAQRERLPERGGGAGDWRERASGQD